LKFNLILKFKTEKHQFGSGALGLKLDPSSQNVDSTPFLAFRLVPGPPLQPYLFPSLKLVLSLNICAGE
jgi:hypothetical protein